MRRGHGPERSIKSRIGSVEMARLKNRDRGKRATPMPRGRKDLVPHFPEAGRTVANCDFRGSAVLDAQDSERLAQGRSPGVGEHEEGPRKVYLAPNRLRPKWRPTPSQGIIKPSTPRQWTGSPNAACLLRLSCRALRSLAPDAVESVFATVRHGADGIEVIEVPANQAA